MMSQTTATWQLAIVEDDPDFRRDIKEFIEALEWPDVGKFSVMDTANFEDAKRWFAERRIDVAILDICQGEPTDMLYTGLEVLNAWKGVGFSPIIIHSAMGDRPEIEAHSNEFVRIVTKGDENLSRLSAALREIFATRIPEIYKAIRSHFELTLSEYMWSFVVSNWTEFSGLSKNADFIRMIVSRLSARFSKDGIADVVAGLYPDAVGNIVQDGKIHPAEYYLKPPVYSHPMLGDVRSVSDGQGKRYVIVLWPSCDLVSDAAQGRTPKAESVLCASCVVLEDLPGPKPGKESEVKKWRSSQSASSAEEFDKLILNNRTGGQGERYHFLPAVWDIPNLVIDFQQLTSIPIQELQKAVCVATLASPFAESVMSRFVRYVSRIGTPDLDPEVVRTLLRTPPT